MRLIAAIAFVILAGALAIAALHGESQSPSTSSPNTSTPSTSTPSTSTPSQPADSAPGSATETEPFGSPTAVPGGSPSAVPAGSGGLAARHKGSVTGWEIALVVGVALAAAGALLALRSRDNEVRLRRRLVPLAAASSVAGVALASVAAACCLISQTSAREVPHGSGDRRWCVRGQSSGSGGPRSGWLVDLLGRSRGRHRLGHHRRTRRYRQRRTRRPLPDGHRQVAARGQRRRDHGARAQDQLPNLRAVRLP